MGVNDENTNDETGNDETGNDDPIDDIGPEVAGLLAAAVSVSPPPSLRATVFASARARRRAGTGPALEPEDSADPVTGYERAIDEIVGLAATITDGEWDRPTVNGWTVKGLVAHIAATESWFGSKIGVCPPDLHGPDESDHVGFTNPAIDVLLERPPREIVGELSRRSALVTGALRALDASGWDRTMKFYAFEGPLGGNVVARMFELWTHQEDLQRALGLPPRAPDAGRLAMMTSVASALLGAGMSLAGLSEAAKGKTARLVLTGKGGGTFTSSLDAPPRSLEEDLVADVTLISDAVEFCRVVAQRLPIDALDVIYEGDAALGRQVLVGASMLAAD